MSEEEFEEALKNIYILLYLNYYDKIDYNTQVKIENIYILLYLNYYGRYFRGDFPNGYIFTFYFI